MEMVNSIPLAKLLPSHLRVEGSARLLKQVLVRGLCLDSRQVSAGDLFIAMPGEQTDGRAYIHHALANGAVAVLAEQDNGVGRLSESVAKGRVFYCDNLRAELSAIAGAFYGAPSKHMALTGITGTNGKTTCATLLAQLLAFTGEKKAVSAPVSLVGTLGCQLLRTEGVHQALQMDMQCDVGMTTPDAITLQAVLAGACAKGAKHGVMEVSSHALAQHRLAGLHVDTAVFTNISRDHLDYHGDFRSYVDAKSMLFEMPSLKHAVINVDDPVGMGLALSASPDTAVYQYSLCNVGADIYLADAALSKTGIQADVVTPWGRGHINSPLLGWFNLENLLAVIGAACAQGVDFEKVLATLPRLTSVPGRMEVVCTEPLVVVDYAHTPDALQNALETLREHGEGRLWVVFGCGGDRDQGKRPQMGAVAAQWCDEVVVTSDNPRSENPDQIMAEIAAGAADANKQIERDGRSAAVITQIDDRAEAITYVLESAKSEDLVLIAGKGHEQYQLIGDVRLPFSDRQQVVSVMQSRWQTT